MRIHNLQHVPFGQPAGIEAWAVEKGYSLTSTKFYENDILPNVSDVDWVVIMGGSMNIYEDDKYPWLKSEKRFIEQAIVQNKIVLGICFGSQLIADVLGASVYRAQHQEIGWFPIEMTHQAQHSPLFSSLPQKFKVFHWHGDTFNLPQGAVPLAYSDACKNQAFLYGNNILALQFHLESTKDSIRQFIENCGDEVPGGQYIQTAEEMLSHDDDFNRIRNARNTILDCLATQNAT